MKVRIMPRLMGAEFGVGDPEGLKNLCGQEVTVARVCNNQKWMVYIEEYENAPFFMEEIECIVDDTEISESEESISVLLGGIT